MASVAELKSVSEELYEKRTLAQMAVRRAERLFVDAPIDDTPAALARLRAARIECRQVEDEYEASRKQLREAVKADLDATLAGIRNGAA